VKIKTTSALREGGEGEKHYRGSPAIEGLRKTKDAKVQIQERTPVLDIGLRGNKTQLKKEGRFAMGKVAGA